MSRHPHAPLRYDTEGLARLQRRNAQLIQQAINAARPRRRPRWPLRGGRRCRYNGSPFFGVNLGQPRTLPFDSNRAAMAFARFQMWRAGWGAVLGSLFGGRDAGR